MKEKLISRSAVESFYTEDKSNINFWLARAEKYSKERVIDACIKSGATAEIAKEIANKIDRYVDSRIKMSEVRPLIYNLLLKRDVNVAKKFKAGEIFIHTSAQTIERFSVKKIAESLVKETELDGQAADQIAYETELFLKKIKS